MFYDLRLTYFVEDPNLRYVSGRALASDLKSEQALRCIRNWLRQCTEHHSHGRGHKQADHGDDSVERPTFLLDVGMTEDAHLRLVENDKAATAPYIALSYVWGKVPEEVKRLYLNKANKTKYLEQIPETDLPKTIQDAIWVTRGLNIRSLWVDALCIVQDDKSLKDREILKMHDIYAGSYLTVQAACENAVMGSFLIKRESHALADQRLRYSQQGSTDRPQYIYMRPAELSSWNQCGLVETRAWCFEEFFLPQRLLVVAKTQMSYYCGDGMKWEGNRPSGLRNEDRLSLRRPAMVPWFQDLRKDHVPLSDRTPNPRLDLLKMWYGVLVVEYTPRIVTNDIDRLRAIAGIAKVIQKRNRDIGAYQAGLWMGDLPWSLLWTTKRLHTRPFNKRKMEKAWRDHYQKDLMFRPSGAETHGLAPSWSWASVIGPVDFKFGARFVHSLLVKGLVRFPPDDDFLGKKHDWDITLDAPIKRVYVSSIRRTGLELRDKAKPKNLGQTPHFGALNAVLSSVPEFGELPDNFGLALFDVAEEEAEHRGQSVLCVFISEEWGLLVEPACTGETGVVKYRRLGTFANWCNFYEGESSERVTLI